MIDWAKKAKNIDITNLMTTSRVITATENQALQ
jgi:hypothetical protein